MGESWQQDSLRKKERKEGMNEGGRGEEKREGRSLIAVKNCLRVRRGDSAKMDIFAS